MFAAIVVVLIYNEIVNVPLLWVAVILGGILGYAMALRVKNDSNASDGGTLKWPRWWGIGLGSFGGDF